MNSKPELQKSGLFGECQICYTLLKYMDIQTRRQLGRFDTPRPIAQALTEWAIQSSSDKILEPSSGGTVFLRSSISRLADLGCEKPAARIMACDIDPLACDLARKAGLPASKVRHCDFLDRSEIMKQRFDVVLGNPPYVRRHRISQADRIKLADLSFEGISLNRKASLWAYFVLKSSQLLRKSGRLAFVLPETLLYSDYGRQTLSWLETHFKHCNLISIRERCFVGEGANERVVLALLDGAHEGPAAGTSIKEFQAATEALDYIASLDSAPQSVLPYINGHVVPQAVSQEATTIVDDLLEILNLKRLGDYAKIRIGIVTGNNRFFTFSEAFRKEQGIHRRHILPLSLIHI